MENIFQLSLKEIDKKMDEILSKTTPEKLIEELKECGYKPNEEIEFILNNNNYTYQKEISLTYESKFKQFVHRKRIKPLRVFNENMEVAWFYNIKIKKKGIKIYGWI